MAQANTKPGAVKSHIQNMPGTSHAKATSHVRRNRRRQPCPAMSRSSRATPTKASGHQPHGGMAAAMQRPASTARPATAQPARVGACIRRRLLDAGSVALAARGAPGAPVASVRTLDRAGG